MLLVVVEIASIAREISLFEYLEIPNQELERHRGESVVNSITATILPFHSADTIPTFGHWGALHVINTSILVYGIAIIGYGTRGEATGILSIVVITALLVLPYLEVKEYTEIGRYGIYKKSATIRYLYFFFGGFAGVLGRQYAETMPLEVVLTLGIFFVLIPTVATESYFNILLEEELKTVTELQGTANR